MKLNKFLILCGLYGPIIFFLTLIILGFMFPEFSHLTNYVSELGAVDSPVKTLMNIFGFFLMGLAMFLFGLGLLRVSGKNWYGEFGSFLLMLAGISMMLVAFFPCDAGCNNYTNTGKLHELFSDTPFYISFFAIFLITWQMHTLGVFDKKWVLLFISGALLTALLVVLHLELDHLIGYPPLIQRFAFFTAFFLMAIGSWKVNKTLLRPS